MKGKPGLGHAAVGLFVGLRESPALAVLRSVCLRFCGKPRGLGRAAVGFARVLEGKPGLGRAAVCLFVCMIEGKPGLGRAAACMFV